MRRTDISRSQYPFSPANRPFLCRALRPWASEAAGDAAARGDLPGVIGVVGLQAVGVRRPLPRVKPDRPVVLAQVGDEVAAMVRAGVARRSVEAAPVPDEPASGHRVLVGAPDELAHGPAQPQIRQRIGLSVAVLTAEDEADGHGRRAYRCLQQTPREYPRSPAPLTASPRASRQA